MKFTFVITKAANGWVITVTDQAAYNRARGTYATTTIVATTEAHMKEALMKVITKMGKQKTGRQTGVEAADLEI